MKTPKAKTHWFSLTSSVVLMELIFTVSSPAATYTVTTIADSGPGSLRLAILDANANAGADTIAFNIPGAGPHTIQPLSELPKITDAIVIDGTTQPGFMGKPVVELDGNLAGAFDDPPGYRGAFGLWIDAGSSTVRGLIINRFAFSGIVLAQGDGNVVAGNFLGVDRTGTVSLGNGHGGSVLILGPSGGHRIGGVTVADRNVISPIFNGIHSEGGERLLIQGNYIGTDWTGTVTLQNDSQRPTRSGIFLSAGWTHNQNRIGGPGPGEGNVVSGCFLYDEMNEWPGNGTGIEISGDLGVLVQGNFIGTDYTGTQVIGNRAGLTAWHAVIGGSSLGAGNVVSGNRFAGLSLGGNSVVQGNRIGTDITGTVALPNGDRGIWLTGENSLVGGEQPNDRNLISGNSEYGLVIQGQSNRVEGNFIGTDVTGTVALPNRTGIAIFDFGHNIVGGTTPAARNVISGNGIGADISGSESKLQGNFIGTDVSGTMSLGNGCGVFVRGNATNNLIGGVEAGAGNLISGNLIPTSGYDSGITIHGPGVTGTRVQGNRIGTDLTGTLPLGNTAGVRITGANDCIIGGDESGAGNVIAHNAGFGVVVLADGGTPGVRNAIRGNAIFDNGLLDPTRLLGIDLIGFEGVTLNDSLDGDTGPNNLQNFPTLTSVTTVPAGTQIQGRLHSTPNTTFLLDFYSNPSANPSTYYEGETYLGAASVTTDGDGNVSFDVTLTTTVPAGRIFTATATDPDGNTSEFSQSGTVEGPITQGPNGHYYQVVRTRFVAADLLAWDVAKVAAEQHTLGCFQGHLATITSRSEDEFIEALRLQFVAGAPEHVNPHLAGVEFWVGGFQLPNQATPKDGWFWINNEGAIAGDNNGPGYANWINNNPSDSPFGSGIENNIENHLAVGRLGSLGWNDEGAAPGLVYGYIIEYDGSADHTPPQINPAANITLPCSTDSLVPVTFTATATDDCDPAPVVACSPASGSGFPVGTTTVTCTATDANGNSSTSTFTVTRVALDFTGFLPPIGGADATGGSFASPVRTFKYGSTIPVKFGAFCGGTPVLTGVHRLQAIKYSDATTAADPIDATPQDAATVGNQFRLADGQWHFNLDTRATDLSVGIWQLRAILSDGSQHTVWIQLK